MIKDLKKTKHQNMVIQIKWRDPKHNVYGNAFFDLKALPFEERIRILDLHEKSTFKEFDFLIKNYSTFVYYKSIFDKEEKFELLRNFKE